MKSIVLLSSGLDSLVNTAMAISKGYELEALTFDYGQRAALPEIERSAEICRIYDIKHHVIPLPWLADITQTSLVSTDRAVPDFDKERLDDLEYAEDTARAVWVPNRNGVFLNIAAAMAEAKGFESVLVGFNKEEGATFPDNTPDFLARANEAFEFSTLAKIKVISFTTDMDKQDIVQAARYLNAPIDLAWPCYYGGRTLCGKCESCVRFFRATGKTI